MRLTRCGHGYLTTLRDEDGWTVSYAGDACTVCAGKQIGLAFKLGGPAPVEPKPTAQSPAVPCIKTKGCILTTHEAPCIVWSDSPEAKEILAASEVEE